MREDRPRIGISACLLGEPVRYDAGHKRDPFLVETVGPHVEWVPVCPEVEAGFGTPRPSMRLVLRRPEPRARGARFTPDNVAVVLNRTGEDVSERLRRFAYRKAEVLADANLSGYILKQDSPSCGMDRVRTYSPAGGAARGGRGLFAEALMARLPNLPVEEEGRMSDPRLRESFIERVFAYRRLRALFSGRWTVGDLVRFHAAHELTLLAHAPSAYRELGRLVAGARRRPRRQLEADYETGFMTALATVATPTRHAKVLRHIVGHFKRALDGDARAELLHLIDGHREGTVPLVVPITLVRHHLRRVGVPSLEGQTYLEPHPRELSLRNHV